MRGRKCRMFVLSVIRHSPYYIYHMSAYRDFRPKRIGFLIYDGITALDVAGPMEAFATARAPQYKTPCYQLTTIGVTRKAVTSESGLVLSPQVSLAECPKLDTLIIPGGRGLRGSVANKLVADWIRSRAKSIRRIASVCTGIYALAPTGLLDGKPVTTHWRFAEDVATRFPALRMQADSLFLKVGQLHTSAGITAGIDLCLALIEEDFGRAAALRVARELVMFVKRSGGQEQYSEPLQFQVESTDALAEVASYIRAHLDRDLSVKALAGVACLSYRQFSRRFRATFKASPAAYVETTRLDEARTRLSETNCNIARLAASIGFASDDAFRRAFERKFFVTPSAYRGRFGATLDAPNEKRRVLLKRKIEFG
jgi:transcriptional regulator GlxA family with amidase domain